MLAGLGWLYLGLMVGAALRSGHALGPGMGLLEALCRPTFAGASHAGMPAGSVGDLALIFLMWSAMVLAMMLPTAGAMIVTYAEIAETAADKHEAAVSPLVLTAGYAAVWLGFAIAATALQVVLTRLALLDAGLATASALFSGAIFIGAGAYQFSALKHACVTLCQRPFPFFLANWSTERAEIFRLGLRQGLYCLGCCWAMMLVMFAVGVMNVVWMAVLGVIMGVEKIMSHDAVQPRGRRGVHCDRHRLHRVVRRRPLAGASRMISVALRIVSRSKVRSTACRMRGRSKATWFSRAIARCSVRACCRSASIRRPKAIARPGPASASTKDSSARPICPASRPA